MRNVFWIRWKIPGAQGLKQSPFSVAGCVHLLRLYNRHRWEILTHTVHASTVAVCFICVLQSVRCWTGVERLCLRCGCWSWSECWPRGERNAVDAWKRLNWSILSRRWPPSTVQLSPGHIHLISEGLLLVQPHAEDMQCRSDRSSSCSSELRTQAYPRSSVMSVLWFGVMVSFRCRA